MQHGLSRKFKQVVNLSFSKQKKDKQTIAFRDRYRQA